MKRLNKKGFTLVELLAVIVILALLMVVATRSIGAVLTNSKKSAMDTEFKKLVTSANTYLQTKSLLASPDTSSMPGFQCDGGTYICGQDADYKYYISYTGTTVDGTAYIVQTKDSTYSKASITNGSTLTYDASKEYKVLSGVTVDNSITFTAASGTNPCSCSPNSGL